MTAMRKRPAREDTEIHQQSPANLFPNSIIQTTDISKVRDRVEQLIAEMQESGKSNFEDADFAPATTENMQVLYREHDIVSPEEATVMKGL